MQTFKKPLTHIDTYSSLMYHFTRGERLDFLASFMSKQFKKGNNKIYRYTLKTLHENIWDLPLTKKDCLKLANLTKSNYVSHQGNNVNPNQPTTYFTKKG